MYHAYNLMTIENDHEISISYLSEMLEGQVATLSSGYLTPTQALDLLNGLKESALFREDQYSYILYPNKELPRFDKKNNIPSEKVEQSTLLKQLVSQGDQSIISKDIKGQYHFNAGFNNANSLKKALKSLNPSYEALVKAEESLLLQIFESVFDHKSFTGRSGTFFGYEGLGSIYWHMVSKLLLAVQENCLLAVNTNESDVIIGKLFEHYYEINAGIGVHKSPELYGAVPTDPYSHTPATKGAQQPGMTGQVKEDILSRFGELGVFVVNGQIVFNPRLLQTKEFLTEATTFQFIDVNQAQQNVDLEPNTLCYTYCQVPIVYKISNHVGLKVELNHNDDVNSESMILNKSISKSIFERKGEVRQITVSFKR